MNVPIILGTARKGRQSEKVAKFILKSAKKLNFSSNIVDVRDFKLYATDNSETSPLAKKLKKIIQMADGLIIVAPEYNYSYPGELKLMLDLLYQDYFGLPVGLAGVSSGNWGGIRVVEQLKLLAIAFGMVPRSSIYFPNINTHRLNNADQVNHFLTDLSQTATRNNHS